MNIELDDDFEAVTIEASPSVAPLGREGHPPSPTHQAPPTADQPRKDDLGYRVIAHDEPASGPETDSRAARARRADAEMLRAGVDDFLERCRVMGAPKPQNWKARLRARLIENRDLNILMLGAEVLFEANGVSGLERMGDFEPEPPPAEQPPAAPPTQAELERAEDIAHLRIHGFAPMHWLDCNERVCVKARNLILAGHA